MAKTIPISSPNHKEVAKKLRKIGKDGTKMFARALYEEGEEIMGMSKRDYVPVDHGTLRNTGHVVPPKITASITRIVVVLGFGGPAADYAIHVHERLKARHPVGQAKYLEVPALLRAAGMGRRIVTRLNSDFQAFEIKSKATSTGGGV